MNTHYTHEQVSGPVASACQSCRLSKRRCNKAKPQCSTCRKSEKECVYETEPKPRKRKYWDEDYVRSLEDQVQALLALQQNAQNSQPPLPENSNKEALPAVAPIPDVKENSQESSACGENKIDRSGNEDRSSMAMEELSVMLWRTNLADAVTVVDNVEESTHTPSSIDLAIPLPRDILAHCENNDRLHRLANLFLEHINGEHQFTQYKSSDFLFSYPHQPMDRVFLHSAMLAAGATFEQATDSLAVGDAFALFSESLVFSCFRHAPSIYFIQGLCILSWRSLALARDHFGWVFLSMAAGMAVHLRLHVLALDELSPRSMPPAVEDVQTFWSFYMTDRTSISVLGRNCVLPWRRVNVPAIEDFFTDNQDLKQISFAWQCKLWHMHDKNMDQIFSSAFDKLGFASQVELLISTHEDLNQFFKSCDERLRMTRGVAPKPVLLFHMAYQMAILVTMPPFLRLFIRMRDRPQDATNAMSLVLRSISNAASSMVRLAHLYCQHYSLQQANPLLIHHLLSAAIVNLMNTTSKSLPVRRHSTRSVRKCLTLLEGLKPMWPLRCNKSITVIKTLATRWDVGSVLQPETHTFWTDNNAYRSTTDGQSHREMHERLPDDDLLNEDVLQTNIHLDMGPEYHFPLTYDGIMSATDFNIFDSLQGWNDFDDLSWVFQGQ